MNIILIEAMPFTSYLGYSVNCIYTHPQQELYSQVFLIYILSYLLFFFITPQFGAITEILSPLMPPTMHILVTDECFRSPVSLGRSRR